MTAPFLVMLLPFVVLLVAVGILTSLEPVRRGRVERFVERTGVTITASSAPYVVDALMRTRRWRFATVLVTVSGCLAANILLGTATFTTVVGELIAVAVMLGTLVGELRNAAARGDAPRTASLVPRQESQYVGPWARTWPAVLAVAAVVFGLVTVLVHPTEIVGTLVLGGVAVVAWPISRAATRFVVDRPRPAGADDDVVAADEGLRSRALHAIGGATCFVSSWSVLPLLVFPFMEGTEESNTPLAFLLWIGLLVAAIVSWRRATRPFHVAEPCVDEPAASADGVREAPAT